VIGREVSVRERQFTVRAGTHDEFWDRLSGGDWEPGTLEVLHEYLGPARTLVDIGAWIGPITLLSAALGSRVVAFEPDPDAALELAENLALNPTLRDRVTVHQVALAARDGEATLTATNAGFGESVSTLLGPADASAATRVSIEDVAHYVDSPEFQRCALLKIDIEGGEYELVPRMRSFLARVRPPLLLSVHSHVVLSRFAHLPAPLKLLMWRARVARYRLPLVLTLVRSYRHRYIDEHGSGNGWRRMTGFDTVRLFISLADRELLLSPNAYPLAQG
jgi:FkbM family methyltransferase